MPKDYTQFDQANEEKYSCPQTGSHFEYLDMCRRLKKM
jgi:transcription initiation factor IIE alpha subunit